MEFPPAEQGMSPGKESAGAPWGWVTKWQLRSSEFGADWALNWTSSGMGPAGTCTEFLKGKGSNVKGKTFVVSIDIDICTKVSCNSKQQN